MSDTPGRVTWLMAWIAAGVLLLAFQLFRLTISQNDTWRVQAQHNMVRELPSFGARGDIYDSKGRALATSEPAFAAVLIKQDLAHVTKMLPKLSLVLTDGDEVRAQELSERVLARVALNIAQGRQFEPLTIERNLAPRVVALFMEQRMDFAGVVLVTEASRKYAHGSLAGSVIGYVGQITGEEVADPAYADYNVEEMVGKAGLELFYERYLRGTPGTSSVLVDPMGRPVSDFTRTPPVPGQNLLLTLDLDLQRVAEEALAKQIAWINQQGLVDETGDKVEPFRGSLVVQNVRSGAILAMVTVPTYDPGAMTAGLTKGQWDELMTMEGFMLNWAIQGFPPGSTYKMATGLAGLEGGVIGPYEQVECLPRYWRYTNPRNWVNYSQGPADVAKALALSCNPYFFEVGHRLGIERLSAFMDQFGFGWRTGIDLPGESPGVNPTETSYGDRWQPGQITGVSIGQGDVLVTPLQLASYTAAVATNGTRYRPFLLNEVQTPSGEVVWHSEPELIGMVEASEVSWQRLQAGMREAVTASYGTANSSFLNFPVAVAAKTGSAETGRGPAHGLSVAYAPYENPEIAVSIIIEEGSRGSWTSPVIRRIMAQYFGIEDVLVRGVPTYGAPTN